MRPTTFLTSLTFIFAIASVAVAQSPSAAPKAPTTSGPASNTTTTSSSSAAQPSEAEMMKQMMELAKLNDNHKVLDSTAGTYSYVVKMWMDPKANPSESTGTATRKSIMDGRYVTGDYSGSFKVPGADSKMKDMNFHGMSLDGYDNVKQKFVSSWIDNMGTGIIMLDGTYDAATKAFTYTGDYEGMPGMKSKVREVITMVDKDHMTLEYYEDRGQGEMKSMEINYTRKK
jgi:hypothetical protein